MLLRFLLLLILLPPSVLSSESHFASLPPPTSLFSPSGQLYQSIYARKGLSTFGGSSSYVLKNSTLLIVNIRPIKKANVTSQISEYKTTITPVSSIKILPSPTPILLSSTSYLPSSLLSSLPTSLPSLLSYLTTSLNKLTLKPSHKTLGNYVNSEDYVVWNGEELYKIEGPEARAWKVNSAGTKEHHKESNAAENELGCSQYGNVTFVILRRTFRLLDINLIQCN